MSLETPKEAAERTIFTEKRIRSWITNRQVRYVKLDGSLFIPEGAIEELIERNTIEPCQDQQNHHTSKSLRAETFITSSTIATKPENDVSSQQALRTAMKLRRSSKTS
ncbi:hypothetical protein PsWM33_02382 [Pseudovibrio sp. WM33]|nr:hypothetical protein PsWM33_02382 [Pseudovibrio sp. WM33]